MEEFGEWDRKGIGNPLKGADAHFLSPVLNLREVDPSKNSVVGKYCLRPVTFEPQRTDALPDPDANICCHPFSIVVCFRIHVCYGIHYVRIPFRLGFWAVRQGCPDAAEDMAHD